MQAICVRAAQTRDKNRVIFDQAEAGVRLNKPARVVIRADGKEHMVNGVLKVVKDAIERGELVRLDPETEAPKAEK